MSTPTQRLAELGLTLPPVAKPLAAYTPAITVGKPGVGFGTAAPARRETRRHGPPR